MPRFRHLDQNRLGQLSSERNCPVHWCHRVLLAYQYQGWRARRRIIIKQSWPSEQRQLARTVLPFQRQKRVERWLGFCRLKIALTRLKRVIVALGGKEYQAVEFRVKSRSDEQSEEKLDGIGRFFTSILTDLPCLIQPNHRLEQRAVEPRVIEGEVRQGEKSLIIQHHANP